MEKWLEEIERIKKDQDPMLDRKCIGIDSCSVIFLDNYECINLSSNYFQSKNSIIKDCWSGCFINPGEISTLRDIHINALNCYAKCRLINDWYYEYKYYKASYDSIPDYFKDYCNQFGLNILFKKEG